MSSDERPASDPARPQSIGAEPVAPCDPSRLAHLAEHRAMIVRRSLLATALGGFIPVPVMDDFIASRVRAGLLMRLAAARQVDLPRSSADLLADRKEGSALRNVTLTAATLIALKLAWRKFFAVLALGRGADEMATTFQCATLVDHYCARLHVGGAVSRERAAGLHKLIHAVIAGTEQCALVGAFRDGGRVLGLSLVEAPRWLGGRLAKHAQHWAGARGQPAAPYPPPVDFERAASDQEAWLERAARAVEGRLASLGHEYLDKLVGSFEAAWRRCDDSGKHPADAAHDASDD